MGERVLFLSTSFRKLGAGALGVSMRTFILPRVLRDVLFDLGGVLLARLGCPKELGEFSSGSRLSGEACTENSGAGICDRDQEIGRGLTISWFVSM
jgi:hypothetical protein